MNEKFNILINTHLIYQYAFTEYLKLYNINNNPEYIIAGLEPYTQSIIDEYKNLKVISRVGVGIDNIDLNYCTKKNIKVVNSPSFYLSQAVANYTFIHILNSIRDFPRLYNIDNRSLTNLSKDHSKYCIGIVGFGRNGRVLYNMIDTYGFSNIIINNISKTDHIVGNQIVSIRDIFSNSNIITIQIPLKDYKYNNFHFINKDLLKLTKSGVTIINTSREKIINIEDIKEWLNNDFNNLYISDVDNCSDFKDYINRQQVILTPHIAGYTEKARFDIEKKAFLNIIDFL